MTYNPNDRDRLWQDSEEQSWFHFPSPFRFFLLILFIIGLILGAWYFLVPEEKVSHKHQVPLIRSDEKPHKIKAEDQSVPAVKHQDKLVYGRIREDKNSSTVEHILPDPEPPIAQSGASGESLKMVEQYQPADLDIEKSEVKEEAPAQVQSIADLIEDTPIKEEVAKKEDTKEVAQDDTPKPQVKTVKGTVFIQLGSLKSYDIAESEWDRLSKKHKDVLTKLKPTIQKVDLGAEKGIYFRLRTGPFDSKEAATKACLTLKERKVECIVVQ